MLASSDDTKLFSYKNKEITYDATALGVTSEIHLRQVTVGEDHEVSKQGADSSETTSPTSDPVSSESNSVAEITGAVFVGMKGSAITLYDDGTADYYWIKGGVKEGNPWIREDNVITVRLSSLNCDIYATVHGDDSTLTFRSDSLNWDDELFIGVGSVQDKPTKDEYYKLVQAVQAKYQEMLEKSGSSEQDDQKTSEGAAKSTDDTQDGASEDMRPEFKEAMDSYEAFYDEYCEVLKQYKKNPSDLTILTEYSEMLIKLSEMDEKFKAWNEDEMSHAELKYYLEISERVTKKMLEVTQ